MRGTVKNEVVEDLVGTEEGIVWNKGIWTLGTRHL